MDWYIDPEIELTETMIPSFLVQPLVENAFYHGVAPKEEGGTVSVDIRKNGDELLVSVSDDGVGISPDVIRDLEIHLAQQSPPDEHIGLYNVAARLRLAGEAYRLSIQDRPEGGTCVSIRMPLIPAGETGEAEEDV